MTSVNNMIKITKDSLPTSGWQEFIKTEPTLMIRIDGPFEVETRNGELRCQDGYLALDAGGWPYPIDYDVQERTYKKRV